MNATTNVLAMTLGQVLPSHESCVAVYDALRFARDEFRDENGLQFSEAEMEDLQRVIDALAPLIDDDAEPVLVAL